MSSKLHKVIVILNPASGVDYPILAELNRALLKNKIEWDLFLTKMVGDAQKFAKKAIKMKPDAVVVYGGDGTVLDVATILYKTEIPMVIIPGGTANIMAKELGISTTISEALKIFDKQIKTKKVDVSLVNKKTPMFLRIEAGIIADMVTNTPREQKDSLGLLAYPVSAVQEMRKAEPVKYTLNLDGKKIKTEGVALMIANSANIGITGVSIQKSVNCFDGILDVFVLEATNIGTLFSIGTSTLTGRKKPTTLKHWKAKKITVKISPKQTVICDDTLLETLKIKVAISPHTLSVLI